MSREEFNEAVCFYYGLTSLFAFIVTYLTWGLCFLTGTVGSAVEILWFMLSNGTIIAPIAMGVFGVLCLRLNPQKMSVWRMGSLGIIGISAFIIGIIVLSVIKALGGFELCM